jgi:cytochrome P450
MKYPGPNLLVLLNILRAARQDAPQALLGISLRYGGVAHFRLGTRHIFLVSSVSGVERVLQSNQHNYCGFAHSHARLRPFLGNGLLTAEGATWRRHRRLVQGAFHTKRLAAITTNMLGSMERYLSTWESHPAATFVVDIGAEMTLLTLHVVTEALFGSGIGAQALVVKDELPTVMHHMIGELVNPIPLPYWASGQRRREFRKALAALDTVVQSIIHEHRCSGQSSDLMGILITAHDVPGEAQLNDQELRDEVMTLLMAGHETCANALTWGTYLLARHPEIQECLAQEVCQVLGGRAPAFKDISSLPLTASVFHETLRLYPPAWIMARDAIEDDEIDGWPIPAGSLILISPYVNHHHPSSWKDPQAFNPARFTPGAACGRPHFAYYPFGGGQRQCLGKNFAQVEAMLILPLLLQRYQFALLPEVDSPTPEATMRPKKPIYLEVRRR